MIFPMLVVKIGSDGQVKIINLANGCEALVESNIYELLVSTSKKHNRGDCSESELELLTELAEQMELKVLDGARDLTIRSGDFDNLEISLTNTCNLRCRHCYFFGNGRHLEGKHTDFDLLTRAIIESEEMGMYKLKLCGGEPLAYYRMRELFQFLNPRSIGTTIITNGLLIGDFIADIEDSSKFSFVVSLDGFEHSHDYLRGKGSFEGTKNNVMMAVEAGFDVNINMVVYDRNVGEIDSFTDFVKDLGVSGLNIQVVRPVGMAEKNLKGNMVVDETFLRRIHQNELEGQARKIDRGESFCNSCKTGLTIDFNNDVVGCPFLPEGIIGNIANEGLRSIHERSLRENPLSYVEEKAECASCELFNVKCAGGCRARAQKMTGSIYACDRWIPFLLDHPKFKEGGREAWEYLLIG